MVLHLPQLETYEKAYRTILQAELPAALDGVMDYWIAQGDPLDLPAIASWPEGPIPLEALLDYVDTLPAIAVEATNLVDDGTGPLIDSLVVHVYIAGDTPEEAHKFTQRYAVACAEVLWPTPFGIGVKERGKLSIVTDEVISPNEALFLKAAHVPVPLHIVGSL